MNPSGMFWVWVIIAAVFIVSEIFTAGFFLFPFGVGAGIAAILTILGAPSWAQWVAFIAVSIAVTVLVRKFAGRITKEPPEKAGVDRLVGETALVTETIDESANTGMISVKMDTWRATSTDGSTIEKGKKVRIAKIDGTHAVVEKIEA